MINCANCGHPVIEMHDGWSHQEKPEEEDEPMVANECFYCECEKPVPESEAKKDA